METTKNKKGFTLVELIIAISVLVILGTVGFISFSGYTRDARDSKRISDIQLLKSSALIYAKSHDGFYPDFNNSQSGVVYSGSLSNKISKQEKLDINGLALLGINQNVFDPYNSTSYIYSVSADRRFFQFAASLEDKDKLLGYENPLLPTTYALESKWCGKLTSYVDGNFIPTDINTVPGLIYAFDYVNTNLDISQNTNLKKVVLNNQSINIAYDYDNNFGSCNGDIFSVSLGTNSGTVAQGASCVNSKGTYITHGATEVIDLTGVTLNSQMGWKYKICNNGIMDKNGVNAKTDNDYYYSCKDIGLGAKFDSKCTWIGCSDGYNINLSTPGCISNVSSVVLASPQNGAYQIPINGYLTWYPDKSNQSAIYKVFLGTSSNSFEIFNGVDTSQNTFQFTNLDKGKMYFWKIQSCDAYGTCKDSFVSSFTTIQDTGTSSGALSDNTPLSYCPDGIICRADDVSISYLGCSSGNSSFNDCGKDNFGTSEKNGNDYFGTIKSVGYRIINNSDGVAKFGLEYSHNNAFTTINSATSFDDTSSININDGYIGNNFYWLAGEGCGGTAVSGYYVSAKKTCYITFYFKSDAYIPNTNSKIIDVKIVNKDTANASWSDQTLSLNAKSSGYTAALLGVTMNTTKYKSPSEPTVSTTIAHDFDTSTFDVNGKGYRKGLTYTISNTNGFDAFFKPNFISDYGSYNINPVNSTTIGETQFSLPEKNIDIGNNGIGNIFYNNGDFNLTNQCLTYKNGFKLAANSSCSITVFFRSDIAISGIRDNIINMKIDFQAVSNPLSIPSIVMYGKKVGGNVVTFNGYFPYSYNGRWTDFSTFQLTDDLTPSGFVRSQTMGWIDMSGSETGSTIKVYFDGDKKRMKGKTYSQTAGWIDFNKGNNAGTQTYIDSSGKLHGWARSDNYGWISFDSGVGR